MTIKWVEICYMRSKEIAELLDVLQILLKPQISAEFRKKLELLLYYVSGE